MINNQLFRLALLLCVFIIGCTNDDKESETKLNAEVMDIHNGIMPKMGEMHRLKRQLTSYKEIIPDDSVALKISVINSIMQLAKSEDMMSDWMSNYKYPNPEAKHEDLIVYLRNQKDSIKRVSDTMYVSLGIAKVFIPKMPDSIKNATK